MPLYPPTSSGSSNYAVSAVKTTTYSIQASDTVVLTDASSGSFTVTLPTAVGVTGKLYIIKRTDQTLSNVVTVATTSSQTIDGNTTRTLNTQNEEWSVVSDGSNWLVTAHTYPQTTIAYTPTITGFGTCTGVGFYWKRDGDGLIISGALTTGTVTAATASITLPSPLTVSTNFPSGNSIPGTCISDTTDGTSGVSIFFTLSAPGNSTLQFGLRSLSEAPSSALAGSSLIASTTKFFILPTRVPISGWEG